MYSTSVLAISPPRYLPRVVGPPVVDGALRVLALTGLHLHNLLAEDFAYKHCQHPHRNAYRSGFGVLALDVFP